MTVESAIHEARAVASKQKQPGGEAAGLAFYLSQGAGSHADWDALDPDERSRWIGHTPLSFYVRVYEPKAGA